MQGKNEKNFSRPHKPNLEFVNGLAERIRELRRMYGYSQTEFSEKLERANNNAVSRLERGTAGSICFDVLEILIGMADNMEHTAQWLLTGSNIATNASIEDLANALHDATWWDYMQRESEGDLTQEEKEKLYSPPIVHGYSTVPSEDVPTSNNWSEKYVPVLGRIAAGEGEDTIEASDYPPAWAGEFLEYGGAPQTAVAVRVKGKSMQPQFRDGDMVIVDPAVPADAGEVCCVLLNRDGIREARLKTFKKSAGWIILESSNPDFPPERISVTAFAAAYKIIKHLPLIVRY